MFKPIIIDDETKLHISTVLKYYRSRQKIKQCDFIRYNDATVCSADTYSRIENGKIIKRNSIYIYLLYQIQATYDCTPAFWQAKEEKFLVFIQYLNRFSIEELKQQALCIQRELKDMQDFLAREIYLLMDVIISFYHKQKALTKDAFEKYLAIYAIFPLSLQEIILDMLYVSTYMYKRDLQSCKQFYEQLHIEEGKSAFIQLVKCREYLFEGRYLDSHTLALSLEQKFQKEYNYQRLLDVYEIMLLLYHKVQNNINISIYRQKFLDLVQEHAKEFHPIKNKQSLYIHGLIQFYQNRYQEAYATFTTLCQNTEYYLPSALFINMILDKDANIGPSLSDPLSNNHHFPLQIAHFYQYFIMKHQKKDKEELENYLVKNVLPFTSPSDFIFWDPLKEELLSLIKDTKHYYIKKKLQIVE